MKKLMALILAVVMFCALGTVAFAVTTYEVENETELKAALEQVQDGDIIELLANIEITSATAVSSGYYVDGICYTGDASFTVNFNGYSITDNGCVNDYLIYIKNVGAKANEITFKNGTIEANAKETADKEWWSALCIGSSSASFATTVNLIDMQVVGNGCPESNANDVVRVRAPGCVLNVESGTVITSNGCSAALNAIGSAVINIKAGAKVIQENSENSDNGNIIYAAVTGTGTVNIYDGAVIESDNYGVHTSTTGTPVVNIYGGVVEAPFALHASTNGAADQNANINVYGGSVSGSLSEYTSNGNINVSGGSFDEDPADYLTDEAKNGTSAVVTSGSETTYAIGEDSVQEVASSAKAGDTVTVKGNATLNNIPEGVKIENGNESGSNANISVNGTEVGAGETIAAPKVEEPQREPIRETVTIVVGESEEETDDTEENAKDGEEANPSTGAPVMMPVLAVAAFGAAVLSKRK